MKVQATFTSSLLLLLMRATSVASQTCDLNDFLTNEVGGDEEVFSETTTLQDAEDLALLLSPEELLAPDDLVKQIAGDLTLIRQEHPKTNAVRTRLPYVPGEILVLFTDEATQSIKEETYSFDTLNAINSEYGPVTAKLGAFNNSIVYEFEARYNAERLVELLEPRYMETGDIVFVEPNRLIGGGHKITACNADDREYIFEFGWGDCPSGCICKEPLTYAVNPVDGTVTELTETPDCTSPDSFGDLPTAAPTSSTLSLSRSFVTLGFFAAATSALVLL